MRWELHVKRVYNIKTALKQEKEINIHKRWILVRMGKWKKMDFLGREWWQLHFYSVSQHQNVWCITASAVIRIGLLDYETDNQPNRKSLCLPVCHLVTVPRIKVTWLLIGQKSNSAKLENRKIGSDEHHTVILLEYQHFLLDLIVFDLRVLATTLIYA